MKQAEMKTKICPIINRNNYGNTTMCFGDQCMAFNSRPTYEYLNEKGEAQLHTSKVKRVARDDKSRETTDLLQLGWERVNTTYTDTYLRREIDPECWCDAMPANAPQCGFEQP